LEVTMREPDFTRAAEKYLEQYSEPLVMNTYLKITVLALCAISVALATLVYRAKTPSQRCTR
jgi:type IV secretion system protein VirB5